MLWHLRRGAVDLYGIEDGHRFVDPAAVFPHAPAEVWTEHPERLVDGRFRNTYGCFLVVDGDTRIMVDTGLGPPDPEATEVTSGQMPSALATIGIRPEQVTDVVLTHLHRDHYGGLRVASGDAFFTEARLWVAPPELEHWMPLDGSRGDAVRETIGGFVDEGRVGWPPDGELSGGMLLRRTPGHTPGHLCVEIRSEGTRTVIAGDVTHHQFQATYPDVSTGFDTDPELAARTRREFFEDLAASEATMAAGHYPGPGYGRVQVVGERMVFVVQDDPDRIK